VSYLLSAILKELQALRAEVWAAANFHEEVSLLNSELRQVVDLRAEISEVRECLNTLGGKPLLCIIHCILLY